MWSYAGVQGSVLAVAAGTQTALSQALLSNANGISFGMSGSSQVTASAAPNLSVWGNVLFGLKNPIITRHGTAFFFPLAHPLWIFPGNMTVSTMFVDMIASMSATNASTQGQTYSLQIGVYTLNGSSSLSLLNSVQTTFGFAANNQMSTNYNGERFVSIHSSQWSSQPVFSQAMYVIGVNILSSGTNVPLSWQGYNWERVGGAPSFQRSGSINASGAAVSLGANPFMGEMTVSTSAMPASVHISNLARSGSSTQVVHLEFQNLISAF